MARKRSRLCLIEQRQTERSPSHPEISCLFFQERRAPLPAQVLDISEAGVSLNLPECGPMGVEATVEFVNQARSISCRRHLRILYTLRQPLGDYRVGGTFSQSLSREELESLCSA